MRDDRTMDTFDVVVAELFGDAVDAREVRDLVSKQNDASEMHVKGTKPKKNDEIPKWQKNVALATNAAGVVAGPAAIALAVKAGKNREGGIPREGLRLASKAKRAPRISNAAGKAVRFLGSNRKAAIATGVTGVGLQIANMTGDAISTKAFMPKRKEKEAIAKALADIVDARRRGVISTDTAIAMSADLVEVVEKKDVSGHNQILDAVDAIAPALPSKKLQAANTGIQTGRKAATKAKRKLVPQQAVPPVTSSLPEPVAKAGPDIVWTGEIAKRDDEKRQVFGFALVTHVDGEPVVDRQGDYTPLEEIEKAAYTYVIESRKGGDMHARDGEMPLHTSDMVESFVITPEKLAQMGLAEDALPHGWWVGFQVNDDKQWDDVKTGKRTGFSIHGSGRRVEKMMGV